MILVLFMLGLAFFWLASRQQAASGLPQGRVVYLDTAGIGHLEEPLYDTALALTGKPDYLVEQKGDFVPVEVKQARAPFQPYPGHILQLAAYCRLVEAVYRQRPAYGVLKYADRAFAIDYTASLENDLLDILAEMRRAEGRAPGRSHDSIARCRACSYRQSCDQNLE